jgi:purine-binding chemotaxis protein CheW
MVAEPSAQIQLATFIVGGEEYALDIMRIKEIINPLRITPVPKVPQFIEGVIELRGAIIPIVDLRAKLAMSEAAYNQFTVIIVVRVGAKTVGVVVDAVSDVLNIPTKDIQPTPDFGAQVDARFISGLAKAGERLVVLLDIDKVLGGDAATLVSAA